MSYKKWNQLGGGNSVDDYQAPQISTGEEKNKLIGETEFFVVCVSAKWCKPCGDIKADYVSLAKKYNTPGKVIICYEDYDNHLSQVDSIPTFFFYKRGELINTIVGADIKRVEGNVEEFIRSQSSADKAFEHAPYNPSYGGSSAIRKHR